MTGADASTWNRAVLRSVIIILVVLVAVVAAVLVTAPRLVDWNDYRELLTRQAEAITGSTVAIEGRISFRLLPTPTLTLARTKLAGGTQAAGRMLLVVDRLDVQLQALPLLLGEVQVGDVRLVRPILQLDQSPGQDAQLPATGRNPVLSLIAIRPHHLTVVDGSVMLRRDQRTSWQFDAIDVEVVAEGQDGPFALQGGFGIGEQPFEIDARIGRLGPDDVATLELELATEEAPASLGFTGAIWWDPDDPRLRGEASLAGQGTRSIVTLVDGVLGHAMPALPNWLDRPFEMSGNIQLDRSRLQLDQVRLVLPEMEADGQLDLALGAEPRIALGLRVQRLELSDPLQASPADLAPLAALPPYLEGEIDLSIAELHYRERAVGRIRLRLLLAGDGGIAIEQASAMLPGRTDLRFEGKLAGAGDAVALQGNVDAVSDDLRGLLTWLGMPPPDAAAGRLRTLSLSSAIAIDERALRLSQADVRVDATQLRGSLDLAIGATAGTRRRLEADVALDRLDVDAYQPDLAPADAAGLVRRALGNADAAIDARIERLTWRGLQMRGLAFALAAENGQLRISDASLEAAGEAQAKLEGQVDLASGDFRWTTEVRMTRLQRLLRRLDFAPPLILARVPPLTLKASAEGRLDGFEVDVEIDDGKGRLTAAGQAGLVDGKPRYELEIELGYPDYGDLLRMLGAATIPDDTAPLSVAGRIARSAASDHTIAGSVRLDTMSVTGLLGWQQQEPRPRFELQLSVGDPRREILIALLELAGLGPAPTLLANSFLGNWPTEPLQLGWLSRLDGELNLSAKGGLVGDGLELQARLQDRKLFVERAALELRPGTLQTELIFDVGRPLPFLSAAIDLRDIDAAWLAAKLDLESVVEGALDLNGEMTAAGSNPYDLVRSLLGRLEVSMTEGRLIGDELAPIRQALIAETDGADHQDGAPQEPLTGEPAALAFKNLMGRFALDRGMAVAQSVTLDLDRAEGTVTGLVDLLLWVADLTFELKAPAPGAEPITLKMVGPLERPQTRLALPEPDPRVPALAR
jgi:uncharacterized protein involved in outer membrane biogenesis